MTSWYDGEVMPIDVIPTKIIPPKRPGGVLRRPRLIDYLHENLERKLLLVTAPAGYGKTTLLIDFAAEVDVAVCWFTLDDADRDPAVFLAHMAASLRQRFPAYGQRSQQLIEHGPGSMRAAAAALVADMVSDIPEYFVLILDDWHLVSDEAAIRELIDYLLRYLPEHAHLIVAGRTILRGPLVRLAAQGAVAGLGADDLRFSGEEVRQVLMNRYRLDVPLEQAARLADEAEGWITAILLTTQGPWQTALANLAFLRDSAGTLYEYLAGEVFDRLEADLRRFLLMAAIPDQFTAALCDRLREAADSQTWIDQIEARNLFITQVDFDGVRWYRFHHLFREFLLARLRRTDGALFADWQRRTAEVLREQGQLEEAVEHYVAAGALAEAAQLMDTQARRLHIAGRRQTLRRWLQLLPTSVRAQAPHLALYEGQTLAEQGQQAEATLLLLEAESAFRARGDLDGQLRAVLLRGWGALARGRVPEAAQTGEEVLRQIEQAALTDPALTADALRLVGDSRFRMGHWSAAEEHLAQALALYREAASDERRSFNLGRTLQDLANVLRSMGRLEEAAALQTEALGLWRELGNPGPLSSCLNNLGYDRYLAGAYEDALKLFEEALLKAEEAGDRRAQGWVLDSIAATHRDRGESELALNYYARVFELANEVGDQALLSWSLDGRGHAYRLAGDLDRAVALFEQARSVAERVGLESQLLMSAASLGVAHVELGEVAIGLAELNRVAAALQQNNSYVDLARVRLWQALGCFDGQDWAAAEAYLQAVLRLGARLGCRPFSLAEGRHLRRLLEWGASRLRAEPHLRQWLDETQMAPVESVEPVTIQVITPHIEVRAFGVGQIWRDGRLLTTADWGRSANARDLLFFLLERAPQRKEEIGMTFWPDLSAGRMTGSFHATKYKARRALGVEFAIFQDDAYQIDPAADIWYDVAEFRRLIASAAARPADDADRPGILHAAIDLYRGHYLSGSSAEWAVAVREQLHVQFFEVLDALIRSLQGRSSLSEVLAIARRGLELDYFREDLHQIVLRMLAQSGAYSEALAHYVKMKDRFDKELGAPLHPETLALVKQIRSSRASKPSASPSAKKF